MFKVNESLGMCRKTRREFHAWLLPGPAWLLWTFGKYTRNKEFLFVNLPFKSIFKKILK